jgi:RecA/RadA recombinase
MFTSSPNGLATGEDTEMGRKAASGDNRTAAAVTAEQKALNNALSQIEKAFGAGAIMKMGESAVAEVEGISSGSLSLDLALGGKGLPRGRIIELFGPESSGKTTCALHAVAEAQKAGFSLVHLGPHRLRTETAGLYAVAAFAQRSVNV